jgi:hypothetical protein
LDWKDVFLHALPALRVDDVAIRPLVDQGVLEPKPGDQAGDRTWQPVSGIGEGVFDCSNLKLPGTERTSGNSLMGNTLRPEALDSNGYLKPPERLSLNAPAVYSVAYLSFWLNSPTTIAESAGDTPKVALFVTSDDGKRIWLNHRQIAMIGRFSVQ